MSDPLAPVDKSKSSKTETSNKSYSSRGSQKFGYAKAVRKEYNDYQAQLAAEKKKAKKRSLWSTIGSIVGTVVAIAAAPFTAGASLSAAAALGLNAAFVAGGTWLVGQGGKELSESGGFFGGKAERKDIEVDRFYESDSASANEAFKQFDEDINDSIEQSALWAGVGHGIAASGILSTAGQKLGLVAKEGANTVAAVDSAQKITSGHGAYAQSIKGAHHIPFTPTLEQGAMIEPSNLMAGLGKGLGALGANAAMSLYQGPQAEEYGYSPQSPSSRNLYNYNVA